MTLEECKALFLQDHGYEASLSASPVLHAYRKGLINQTQAVTLMTEARNLREGTPCT